jgi:hypothetical protein
MLAQATTWDTEQDAREFYDAYVRRTRKRSGLPVGSEALGAGDNANIRFTSLDNGSVAIQRRGSRVLIIEGVPPKKSAVELLNSLQLAFGDRVQY